MAVTRRSYTGGAVSTTTSTSISSDPSATTTITINAYTGWPYGTAPFFVVVEPGTASEEKVLVTRSTSTDANLSVYTSPSVSANRGLDGTSAVAHGSGVTVYPVFTATDADEANEMASTLTTKGDLLSLNSGTDFVRLGVGTNDYVLVADSAATPGLKWSQVPTAGITDSAVTAAKIGSNAVTAAKIDTGAVTEAKLGSGAVTTTKIADLNVTAGKLAAGAVTKTKWGETWTSYTPSWTNLTPGNGTVSATYMYVPGGMLVRGVITFGSTTSISGNVSQTVPNSESGATGGNGLGAVFASNGSNEHEGVIRVSSTTATFYSNGNNLNASNPIALGSGDVLGWNYFVPLS